MNKVLEQSEHHIMDELVVRARSERDAFGQLYDRIYAPVFRYCIRRTSDRSLAEDLTSTVFLNVANNIAAFPGEVLECCHDAGCTLEPCMDCVPTKEST